MKLLRITLAVVGAFSILVLASACGGGSGSVPDDAVAVVDGTEIAKAELDELLSRAKKGYESQDRDFPKVGTPEYQSLQTQYVEYLVQREEFEQAAEELDVNVSDKDIDKAVNDFVKSRFGNDRKQYAKALQEQGYTEADFRQTIAVSVLAQKIFEKVTKDVKVTEPDILAYYSQNQDQYRTPESRDVRHILIAEKSGNDQVDFAKSKTQADRIYSELRGGADFAALAKESSADPGSKDSGGRLTISRGQTVPEFDKVAFELDRGEVSRPVKTQYGYHVIEALSPVRAAKVTSLADVRATIRSTLLQEKKNDTMSEWVEDLRDEYEGKVSYAAGYEPPELPDETSTDTTTESPTE
jgi:parvulin-like peptidyl-prolyl isomerase